MRVRAAAALVALAAFASSCTSEPEATPPPERIGSSERRLELVDVAREVGLDVRHGAFRWGASADPVAMTGGGLCWLDYDGDGRLDLFVVNGFSQVERPRWRRAGGLPTTRLFRNVGGRFVDVTARSGAGFAVRGQGCVAADLDRDGRTDLFVTTADRSLLLWNEGDGTFTEGAEAAGVHATGWLTGAAVGDLNGDGWPELFVAGYVDLNNRVPEATLGFPSTYLGARDLLFLNEGRSGGGRATFREVGRDAGLEVTGFSYGLGAVLSDLDRDGDLDLYVAEDTRPNRLYENVAWPGGAEVDPAGLGFRFEERAAPAGVADAGSGMGVAAGDYDGDGLPDLFVTNARRQVHAVFRGEAGGERWADVREELGPRLTGSTGWGVSWGDLDLDGELDLVLVNGHVPVSDLAADAERVQVFVNRDGRFRAAPPRLPPLNARGSALADFDDDGDLDVAVLPVGGPLVLLENVGSGGTWLTVDVGGVPGTLVTAVLPDGRRLTREVVAGSSYLSTEDPRAHFGLGDARRIRELVVRWPGGHETRLADIEANRKVAVEIP